MYFVYRFLDNDDSVIYVGKSKQELQQRFMGHNHLPDECYSMVRKIEYIECPTEADMSIKEIFYINKYKNNTINFNMLDVTELPKTIEFHDEWKIYLEALPPIFSNSINYQEGYAKAKVIRYNKDGTIDKRRPNKFMGIESSVEGLSSQEVNLLVEYFISELNNATNENQKQIRFRNLLMFVLGVNLPLKTNDFLNLKYNDLFDERDIPKSLEIKLGRFHKDEIISIPLKANTQKILLSYKATLGLSYKNNAHDSLFQSRKHQVVSSNAWWRILSNSAKAVGITKNIGAESIRKTYGLNIFDKSPNKFEAINFLGELWGHTRESQVLQYLNIVNDEIDFDYYLSETFSLCDVDLSKIQCLQQPTYKKEKSLTKESPQKKTVKKSNISLARSNFTNSSQTENLKKEKSNRIWSKEEKLKVVNTYLNSDSTMKEVAAKFDLDVPIVSRWVNSFKKYGEDGLEEVKVLKKNT